MQQRAAYHMWHASEQSSIQTTNELIKCDEVSKNL